MYAGVHVTAWFAPPDKQPEKGNLTLRSDIIRICPVHFAAALLFVH